MRKLIVVIALAAALGFVATRIIDRRPAPPSQVTRSEVVAIAERYVSHEWTPAAQNAFHGVDAEGIRVDTPDALFQGEKEERGWWIADQRNVGFPYKWGGFDTPEEFDRGLREGKYAGGRLQRGKAPPARCRGERAIRRRRL